MYGIRPSGEHVAKPTAPRRRYKVEVAPAEARVIRDYLMTKLADGGEPVPVIATGFGLSERQVFNRIGEYRDFRSRRRESA